MGAGGADWEAGREDGLPARETWSLLYSPPLAGFCWPLLTPHRWLSSWRAPLPPPPPPVCGHVSWSLTPLPCPMQSWGVGRNSGILARFPSTHPHHPVAPVIRRAVCLSACPLLWVFPAGVMEPVAMGTASVYRTHRSQSPLTVSLPTPSLTQQQWALSGFRDLDPPPAHLGFPYPYCQLPPPPTPHAPRCPPGSSPLNSFPPLPAPAFPFV